MLARRAIQVVFLELIVTPAYVGQADPGRIITLLQEAGLGMVDIYDVSRKGLVLLQFDVLFAQRERLEALKASQRKSAPKTQKGRARTPCPLVSILARLLRESTAQHAEAGQRGAKQRER
jgi:hypothetical protein